MTSDGQMSRRTYVSEMGSIEAASWVGRVTCRRCSPVYRGQWRLMAKHLDGTTTPEVALRRAMDECVVDVLRHNDRRHDGRDSW